MYNTDTELLFPSRVIPTLRDLRGKDWQQLVDRVVGQEPTELDHLAFILMMVRLNSCTSCNADSFRAMRGCTQCAVQNVRRHRDGDDDLTSMFLKARKELEASLVKS
ncbi:MAG: hypothetical protein OEZ02_13665 [Anaerolineae bacterium]|nr:hypothetical protein [Anaerolineae bacterium]